MSVFEFDELLLTNTELLKPFAVSLTRDSEVAKDLIQETVYRALKNRDKYNVGTNIKAWLHTIMRNIFINNYRKKVKQQTVLDKTPNEFLLNHQQSAVTNEAENILKQKDIQQAIHKLPVIFKQPFVLYFEGYKYHEIAKILNEPLGTVKSRIHFARKLLKEQLTRF
ncbi:RNA polymerase sigma factor [Ferruginibacter sp. SUN002]|uniref:RNA polymerase sigma factor n=1 Tax=Ferruginibacter sp. SUN002 TaxID=2937789 RepID=UPI003D35AFB7